MLPWSLANSSCGSFCNQRTVELRGGTEAQRWEEKSLILSLVDLGLEPREAHS